MKNFLRILAIIFLLVIGFTIITSGILSPKKDTVSPQEETVGQVEIIPQEEDASQDSEEENLEDIIDPLGADEGVVILGGDGIPNN